MLNSFKFLKIDNTILHTYEEKHEYLMEFSAPYRNHTKGALFSKRVWKAFVVPILQETPIMTKGDIERVVLEHTIDANTIPDGAYIDPDGFTYYEDGSTNYPGLELGDNGGNSDIDSLEDIEFELNN
jgi:hypothetical protein